MRFEILVACMVACTSSSSAATLPPGPPRGGACLAPSPPDHKVEAYPAMHLAPVKAIVLPEQSKGPKDPEMPDQQYHRPAFLLPELHRKITVHDEVDNINAQDSRSRP